jgi:colanic acid/amylovoran biosynthesis glycosyltransferase
MKNVFLFTHSFPFAKVGESFIENELQFASSCNTELTIVPLYSLTTPKPLPEGIKIIDKLFSTPRSRKIRIFTGMFFNPLFYRLFYYKLSIYKNPKNWYNALKYLYGGLLIKDFLLRNTQLFPENSILYSFWFNYTVLGFALAREKSSHYKSCKFYSRAHRYDLYGEEEGIFIPYREKMFSAVIKVYPGSADGVRFLSAKYPEYADKIELRRLGVLPVTIGQKKNKEENISLISCSNIIPVKRVDLIYESIKHFCDNNQDVKVSWLHIGGGTGMNSLSDLIKSSKPTNLKVSLPGYKMLPEIIEILGNSEFDAFINLSLSEGLPVTLMMAISAGIPVIATDAGGSNEIVTPETGCLLPLSFSPVEFSNSVKYCTDNQKLRESALQYFQIHFFAEKNYKEFYNNL